MLVRETSRGFFSASRKPVLLASHRIGYSSPPRPAFVCLSNSNVRTYSVQVKAGLPPQEPLRKQLKDEARQHRVAVKQISHDFHASKPNDHDWELTVGIEIHAQLNTDRKLFSNALTSTNEVPNANAALFDLAFPGSQPIFQTSTVLPALRAAVALGCDIQRSSKFDRKHYFYQDQPAGYQITQYYEPFAKNGHITLFDHDGIAPEDGESITIGIKQIQLEQDTAKTILQPPDTMLLDFNRVGHPLIEIISLPQIHHPQTAAAFVRKIQSILHAVSAVATGMEMGGLRADVNVSVRSRHTDPGPHSYHGISGLGQRTEIKNLSSFKAVEDAIIAERDRQINVLESGGIIEGETRGWTLGSTETKKLRGKEGEVDYRYMPDPDIGPLIISKELLTHIETSLPTLPDEQIYYLVDEVGLSPKDAKTLVALDGGERLDYLFDVIAFLQQNSDGCYAQESKLGKTAANWVIHELGGLLSASNSAFSADRAPVPALGSIISNLLQDRITGRTAKLLLSMVFDGDRRDIDAIITEENLRLETLSSEQYDAMAQKLLSENPEMVAKIQGKGQIGKLQFFIGQMMRIGGGKVEARKAEGVLRRLLQLDE
ncbi:hypothetical protein MMC11_006106 [Xylographa trunciseda]|nr:hypothetical protein [Xylographa trunciseda]